MIRGMDNPLAMLDMDRLPGVELGMQVRALWEPTLLLGWLKGPDSRGNCAGWLEYAGQERHEVMVNTFSWSLLREELCRMVNYQVQGKLNQMRTPSYALHYEEPSQNRIFFRWHAIIIDLFAYERLFDEPAFVPGDDKDADWMQDFDPNSYSDIKITHRKIVSGSHSIMPILNEESWT